eukprot:Phypoly_transcript_11838.p1 GENE.Phypoly_transcript_11838~~Phypoly_transcript_11838.p1  ORF type:complete len:323 (+),score=51.73 Phypoly_transcript_11838:65-970(+)
MDALNSSHGIAGFVHFEAGESGLTKAVLSNPSAGSKLEVYLYGAHISSWVTQHGEQIFMSKKALYGQGKAIRGGVPVIFPQFGPGKIQNHGFARNTTWTVAGTRVSKTEPVTVTIDLHLKEDQFSLNIWNHPFETTLSIHLSNKLAIDWTVKNTGKDAFDFQTALHTYFTVSDIKNASVVGLKGVTYIDKTKNAEKSVENRPGVVVGEEVDRVYLDVKQNPILLVDKERDYTLKLFREGFEDVVVWNPWVEKAKGMADLGEEAYPKFICIEVGQVGNPVKLAAGQQWVGKHTIETSNQSSL